MHVEDRDQRTPRQLMEMWTPGVTGDGSELALVLAAEATAGLINSGAITECPTTRAFMVWYSDQLDGDD